ncbi:glutathione peroxidase [Pseudomonas sp. 1239]|uniref:glutathione peroxidase n=1 Tax=Pseudomonas TaxID=286 RepID=UPI000B4FB852|nr:glutathione peroxidase [Pseudomonas sp. 1239]OUM28044.1 glutathione peroxidase [Pseudomonas sp. 1239]
MSNSLYDIPLQEIDGTLSNLGRYRGKVLLLVNVASRCGLTPQYSGLEQLYQRKQAEGLQVLGFPANNFKQQEPGSDAEIAAFCSLNYGIQFPLFSKLSVNGDDRHPLYAALTAAQPESIGEGPFRQRLQGYGIAADNHTDVLWNFEKFLVDRSGQVVARFAPDVAADDPRLLAAIETQLATPA